MSLVLDEFGTAPLISIKDPRICQLVPLWRRILRKVGYRLVILNTHRHPVEVAQSLAARDGLSAQHALLLWLGHVLQSERATCDLPRTFTNYDTLIANPLRLLNRVSASLSLPFPKTIDAASDKILNLIDPALRHHLKTANTGLPDLIAQTLQILENWSSTGENRADHTSLDQAWAVMEIIQQRLGADEESTKHAFETLEILGDLQSGAPTNDPRSGKASELARDILSELSERAGRNEVSKGLFAPIVSGLRGG